MEREHGSPRIESRREGVEANASTTRLLLEFKLERGGVSLKQLSFIPRIHRVSVVLERNRLYVEMSEQGQNIEDVIDLLSQQGAVLLHTNAVAVLMDSHK